MNPPTHARPADLDCDVLILGGGSAGCVLAARLSEEPRLQVTLVEAGGAGDGVAIRTPLATPLQMATRLNNWALHSVPQPGLDGRRSYQPRGRALGGSSAINAMVYMRGHPSVYDEWAALGNRGWSFDEVLPYFRRAEHNEDFADAWHGRGGPLNVASPRTDNPFHARWLQAGREAGLPVTPDFNGAQPDGVGIHQVTQKDGERCSAYRAYLEPVRRRPNLRILTGAAVQRVLLDGRRAIGAEVLIDGVPRRLRARLQVVVSCGALHSPQLLMASGIGDPGRLAEHGVAPLHTLPGVGRNLQDHVDFVFAYHVPDVHALGLSPAGGLHLLRQWQRWRRERRGLVSSNYAECGAFLRKTPHSPRPDFQLMLVTAIVDNHARTLHLRHGLSCHLVLLHPRSRGTVSLAGPTMATPPRIDPRFLSHPADLADLVQGFKQTRALMRQPALARHIARELFIGGAHSDEQIAALLRRRSDTVYHPVGTCRMGRDPSVDPFAVVDDRLRVHGLQALRVVDASVMPTIPGGNTNAPTIMVAEKAADLIRHELVSGSAAACAPVPPSVQPWHALMA